MIMPDNLKVLAFDVFGTVVDWHSSVIAEGEQLGKAKTVSQYIAITALILEKGVPDDGAHFHLLSTAVLWVALGLTVFALLAAFVAIFVVASTFSLSVQQRHRELALFRAIGCTPRQVRQLVAGDIPSGHLRSVFGAEEGGTWKSSSKCSESPIGCALR